MNIYQMQKSGNISEVVKTAIKEKIATRVTYKEAYNKIAQMVDEGKIYDAIEKAIIAEPMPRIQRIIYTETIEKVMKGE